MDLYVVVHMNPELEAAAGLGIALRSSWDEAFSDAMHEIALHQDPEYVPEDGDDELTESLIADGWLFWRPVGDMGTVGIIRRSVLP